MKRKFFSLMFLLVCFSLVLSVFVFAFVTYRDKSISANAKVEIRQSSVLILGLDEAADNTDVIMVARIDNGAEASLLQIPRDTYIKNEFGEGKVNRLYRLYTQKYGMRTGMDKLMSCLSSTLSIPLDFYAVFTGQNLTDLVDTVGGVTLCVPHAFTYVDSFGKTKSLLKGERHLDGETALAYVRYRAGYVEGDLGRLDAQMRFAAALLKRIFEEKSIRTYWQIYQKNYRKLLTNVEEKDIISLITMYVKSADSLSVKLMRLPGEALRDEGGAWYYVLNKRGTSEMLFSYFLGASPNDFDKDRRFLKESVLAYENVYYAKRYDSRIYTLDEASRAEVLHK